MPVLILVEVAVAVEDGVLVTIMESVIHGKMRITVHQTVDVTMMGHVRVSEENRYQIVGWTVDATRMLYVNLIAGKPMEIVKIVHQIRVEVVVAQLVMGIHAVKT